MKISLVYIFIFLCSSGFDNAKSSVDEPRSDGNAIENADIRYVRHGLQHARHDAQRIDVYDEGESKTYSIYIYSTSQTALQFQMWFHVDLNDYLLFKPWLITNSGGEKISKYMCQVHVKFPMICLFCIASVCCMSGGLISKIISLQLKFDN